MQVYYQAERRFLTVNATVRRLCVSTSPIFAFALRRTGNAYFTHDFYHHLGTPSLVTTRDECSGSKRYFTSPDTSDKHSCCTPTSHDSVQYIYTSDNTLRCDMI